MLGACEFDRDDPKYPGARIIEDRTMPLSAQDHAALLQCLMLGERHPEIGTSPQNSDDDWYERATWACYVLQYRNLNLRPWEPVPSEVDLDGTGERDAAARQLLGKMLAANMSRFDPDPLAALKASRRRMT